jgi:hypothetical protein
VSTLRMRVSPAVSEGGGTVLIASLDDVLHTLRLEDVWMWRGDGLMASQTYTQRREKLKEFVQYHWVPDARLLGGIFTTVAQPLSMEKFAAKKTWDTCNSVEFIPDMPGKRRMVWYLEAQVKAAEAHAALKQFREPVTVHTETVIVEVPSNIVSRRVLAAPVDKMPDVYDLYDPDGLPLSRASVQQFSLSLKLREAAEKNELWVMAIWRPEFGGYEITSLA